jgi:hypothetical protein
MTTRITFILVLLAFSTTFYSCKKEVIKEYAYGVNDETVSMEGTKKPNLKTPTEFISIAYSDVFGSTITNEKLVNLTLAYNAFGDKKLIEDLIIRNFLNNSSAQLPTKAQMDADVDGFITSSYKKLLNRTPNEMELWQMKEYIKENSNSTPELFYYSILTSNEYRYY